MGYADQLYRTYDYNVYEIRVMPRATGEHLWGAVQLEPYFNSLFGSVLSVYSTVLAAVV